MARRTRHNGTARPIVVLQSVALEVAEPSYVNWIADELVGDDAVRLRGFSYPVALLGQWDVLHVHWPEDLLRRGGRARRYFSALLFLLLVARIHITRRRVVRTMHNLQPHDPGNSVEAHLQVLLDRTVSTWVRLNPFTPLPDTASPDADIVLIPHGHYRHLVTPRPRPPTEAAGTFTVLFFGYVKPYKGIERLLTSFREVPDTSLRLRIAGRTTSAMRQVLAELAGDDPRIRLHPDYLSHDDLAIELRAADLVVLPYLAGHNSGAVLHALSADRPVLVTDSDVHRWLAEETGPGWVLTFNPPLDAAQLASAVATARANDQRSTPCLTGRDWSEVAHLYRRVFLGNHLDARTPSRS